MRAVLVLAILDVLTHAPRLRAADATVAFTTGDRAVQIEVDRKPFATYVYKDDRIPRPYFAHVYAPNGVQVTRNHPPVEGKDFTDHPDFHLGLWLAFGDLGG